MGTNVAAAGRARAFILSTLSSLALASAATAAPVPVDPDFEVELLATGLDLPTALAFTPDGRIFIAEKSGIVRVFRNGALLEEPLIRLTDVNLYGDRGLHGIAVDPSFETNGYLYLLYTHENTPGTGLTAPKTGRLVRVTVTGDVASESSKVVLLGTVGGTLEAPSCEDYEPTADCIPSDAQAHSVGALRFGTDGNLFVGVGDGAHFAYADPRSMRAQDKDRLSGKVLRIRPDGTGLPDNPFYDGDESANRSKVWMYGLRYPYRFGVRPADGSLYIGDVGWRSWEEVDRAAPGSNFGWPCNEGFFPTEHDCIADGAVDPIYAYSTANGAAVIAGGFPGGSYPPEYRDSFFFGDYVKDHIRRMHLDANGDFLSVEDFVTTAGGPVDIRVGPDGDLYYLAILEGALRRIVHAAGNRRPTAEISADTTSGLAPLVVGFSSAGSFDPDGDALTFAWTFGDGTTSTEEHAVHTYTSDGVHTALLKVSDPEGRFDVKSLDIVVGNRAPAVSIDSPQTSTLYDDLETIQLEGSAVDPEDGPLTGASLHWQIILHHNVHIHFLEELEGSSPTFAAPDHGATDVYLEVILTATDSEGLSSSTAINLYRDNSPFEEGENIVPNPSVELESEVPGLPLNWRKGGFGTNTASLTYPVPGFEGEKAVRIDVTSYTSGDRKWYFDPVYVTPGREYLFSNYYMSDVETRITVELTYFDGSHLYLNLGTVAPSASSWTKAERSFVVPPDVRTATVFHGIRAVGYLAVDDYSLALVDRTPPQVTLISPAPNEVVSGLFRMEAAATDNTAIESVTFLLDGVEVREELHPPYRMYLDTTALTDGAHVIAARARDGEGNSLTTPRTRFYVMNHDPNGPNAVVNPSVETPSSHPDVPLGFHRGAFGTHDATFRYPVPGPDGGVAVRIDVTSHTSGQARWYFDDVPVVPGREYLFSDTYVSNVPTAVWARVRLSDDSFVYPFLGWAAPSATWRRARFVFVVPADAVSATVFHSIGAVGTLVTDAFALQPTGNLVTNPTVDSPSPFGWRMGGYGENERSFTFPVPGVTGGAGLGVTVAAHTSGDAKWYSDDIPVTPGETYIVSDYYRSSVGTSLKLRVRLQDGSFFYPLLEALPPSLSWARAEAAFTAPPEAVSLSIFHFIAEVGFLDTDEFSVRGAPCVPPRTRAGTGRVSEGSELPCRFASRR